MEKLCQLYGKLFGNGAYSLTKIVRIKCVI